MALMEPDDSKESVKPELGMFDGPGEKMASEEQRHVLEISISSPIGFYGGVQRLNPLAVGYESSDHACHLHQGEHHPGIPDTVVCGEGRHGFEDQGEANARYDSGYPVSEQNTDHDSLHIDPLLFEAGIQDLFIVTERSIMKTVADKLVVMVAHLVDHRGDVLILDNMGISLRVPPGAIPRGQKQVMTLVLVWDLGDSPEMEPYQALVSPVVYCGPHGLKLNEQCILSYRHCAYDPASIKIMVSETELTHQKEWNVLCEAKEEAGKCVVTQDECQVKLDHFSLLSSIQCRPDSHFSKKWIQIAVFSSPLQPDVDHYQIRVYFLNKTPCALEWAINNESQFGSKKCCPEKVFLYSGNAEDMLLSIAYLSERWACIDGCETQRVPFINIWHGKCPHLSMCFKRIGDYSLRAEEINIHLLAYQDGRDNESERLIIHMTEIHKGLSESGLKNVTIRIPGSNPCSTGASMVQVSRKNHNGTSVDVRIDNQEPHFSLDEVQASMAQRNIFFPDDLKRDLMILLDPRSPLGNDWRALASQLSLDQVITFLESIRTSQTLALLQHMEQKGACMVYLQRVLTDIGRLDASNLVAEYINNLGTQQQRDTVPKVPVESELVT
ncbi:UNC5C-like protein [Haliotis rubra]|uniref:UNC5C-like protein n=1 Tax=Haliotis rubra TaxID=36100 RepID=UPI001EE5E1F4|nr:UNC5C-like protein [Haliotis rubra]